MAKKASPTLRRYIVTVHPIKGSEPKVHKVEACDASIISPDSATEDPGIFCLFDNKKCAVFAVPLHRLIEAVVECGNKDCSVVDLPNKVIRLRNQAP